MHILFVHENFPAQFGHIASHLRHHGAQCTFVSRTAPGQVDGIEKIHYKTGGGATKRTHYCSRTFENMTWHAAGIYEALKPHRDTLRPDLIVGHSGLGPTVFLHELFPDTPVINYFEYFYRPRSSDLDFRPDRPPADYDRLRSRTRNAMLLLDFEYCQAGYTPTEFQLSLMPEVHRPKVRVIHDGVPTGLWRRSKTVARRVGPHRFGPKTRVVTYVSRGLESMRGFDIFMQMAKCICEDDPRVIFLVVGSDRVCYGGDLRGIEEQSFKDHILKQDDYDLDRILFLGTVSRRSLVQILSLSDLHIYLTAPFVLSWSLLNAMSCECTVLGSNTAPVQEVIQDGENGLLCDFFDVDGLTTRALEVLRDPAAHRMLGAAARATVCQRYSQDVVLPKLVSFYQEVADGGA